MAEKKIYSADVLKSFAKLASDDHLNRSTDINHAVSKIAAQETINDDQIDFVIAETNKNVFHHLFKMNKEASYNSPIATKEKVIKKEKPMEKKASVQSELSPYNYAPVRPMTKTASELDMFKVFGVENNLTKEASDLRRKELKCELNGRLEKLASIKEQLIDLQIVERGRIEQIELEFIKTARNLIIGEDFSERPKAFEKFASFLSAARRSEADTAVAGDLLKKLAAVLDKQGLVKEASLKAPEDLISKNLPAEIINGNHVVYVTLKTLYDCRDRLDGFNERLNIVDDQLPMLKEKIREL